MLGQVMLLIERLGALITLVRLLATVRLHMLVQIGLLRKSNLTLHALIRLFATVKLQMIVQIGFGRELLLTHATLERFFATVHLHMVIEARFRSESLLANAAFVGLLTVRLHVFYEESLAIKRLATLITIKHFSLFTVIQTIGITRVHNGIARVRFI